jgi:hypothetical protein
MTPALDPARFGVRESRDSELFPKSTPIILACDVTGSMGMVAEDIVRHRLDMLVREIIERRPVSDPHLMVMATGDAFTDYAPIQATQFETDIKIAEQMTEIWLEGNGGGNAGESYALAHAFAAMKTSVDSFEKRGAKGFLFTIGDEPILDRVTAMQMKVYLGIDAERDFSAGELIAAASRMYEVYHILLRNEGFARHDFGRVYASWRKVLPERILLLDDYTKVPELIVSILEVAGGKRAADVAASWRDRSTARLISHAIGTLSGHGRAGM